MVRVQEILDSRAFPEKLRVKSNDEAETRIISVDVQKMLELLACLNRDCAPYDDERWRACCPGNLPSGRIQRREVCIAVL